MTIYISSWWALLEIQRTPHPHSLQILFALFLGSTLVVLLRLILVHGDNDVAYEYHIRQDGRQASGVGRIPLENSVYSQEVRADGNDNHGKGEGHELENNIPGESED
jgi:hypothetical protein